MTLHDREKVDAGHWSIERWMAVLTFVMSAVAFVFALGFNYAEVQRLRKDLEATQSQQESFKKDYLRSDLAAAQYDSLGAQIQQLHAAIDTLQRALLTDDRSRVRR